MSNSKPKRPNRNTKPPRFSASVELKRIYEWFVKPLALHAGMTTEDRVFDMNERIEIALGGAYRSVAFAKATESFKLPPTRWQPDAPPTWLEDAPEVDRLVKPGDTLVLRSDVRTPDVCEVEFKEHVYTMGPREFAEVEAKCKVVV